MRRHELSDAQWELIADLMPRSGQRGDGRWRDRRQVVNGLMGKLGTGAQWRDLPERYGPWQTVCERFSRWRREGLFDRLRRRRRSRPVIPPRKGGNMGQGCPRSFDPGRYRRRNAIERCVERLKGRRSVATRHEKLAVNFATMLTLAILRQYLRTPKPPDRT